jgi:hypothetical protein
MSQTDTQNFLTDLFTRFDSSLDLSEGSRVQTELIEPIMARIGGDPFDDDIETFIRTRLQQVRPDLAITEADELTDLVIDPMRILLEPITRELQLVKLRTSLSNLSSLSDDEVDALMGNFFEARRAGGYAVGSVRAYFAGPQNVSVTLVHVAQSRGGNRYLVTRPQAITADQMLLNVEGTEYYFDINYVAENRGSEYNVERGEINSISSLTSATRFTNPRRFTDGIARESSTEYVARVQQGSSDKTLTTAPGIIAVLKDNFPGLRQLFEVGYGDPEMQRDILRGGSLGAIPANDDLGEFYGFATPIDDLDADSTTNIIEAASGNFVTRIGAAGLTPDDWFVTVTYNLSGLVVRDVAVTEVMSDERIRVALELPLSLGASSVVWMLRKRQLTISGIPGGVTLPDTPNGELLLPSDVVHIGGKTDIFVAGEVEAASAQIVGMTDEAPLARGAAAQTQGSTGGSEDIVMLPDIDSDLFALVRPGMSLVLTEGTDLGAYRITQVQPTGGPTANVRIDTAMTGTQPDLTWKIVDEIDIDLVNPKDILLEGNDLILSAGSALALTASGTNFSSAGVHIDDILFVDNDLYGGDFTITAVTATALTIDPPAPRALGAVHYVISRRSEGVQRPVLRVSGLELLDSAGAPNGTTIPYRDPVLCVSKGFQNEGTGFLFEGPAALGLVSQGFTVDPALSGLSLNWEVRDPARAWAAPTASGSFVFAPGSVADLAASINANAPLQAAGVRAVALPYAGSQYLGITSVNLVTLVGGTSLAALGWWVGASNAQIRGTTTSLGYVKVRRGDIIECVGGNSAGRGVRVIADPAGASESVTVGTGPLGPPGTSVLYDNAVLSPEPGARIRVARPSLGSVRCYFLEPTSINFSYATTRFKATLNGQESVYQPDPENTRVLLPAPPSSTLPATGVVPATGSALTDANVDFLAFGVHEGDLLEILYQPITGTTSLADPGTIAVSGLTLFVRLDNDPFIQVSFPYAMTRGDIVDYINAEVGTPIASLNSGALELKASRRIELGSGSTALTTLFLTTLTSDHTRGGVFVVQTVAAHQLTTSSATPIAAGSEVTATHYRIRRYLQRVSSTEMNLNVDASGLYYADVEAVSVLPGDYNNLGIDVELDMTGYSSDGYRLTVREPELSFSRAEDLHAEVSRSILLVGASDNPLDYVQLNLQNVQVSYERSALTDEIQSFCSSRYRRVICEDILVRHLFPHYISLNWRYSGGSAEPAMTQALVDFFGKVEAGQELEVGAAADVLRGKQATSVFSSDARSATGRTAPLLLVVRHDETRRIRASLVRDTVNTVRMATYLPDNLLLKRLSSAGLR